jgi:hypothetical protein
MPTAHQKRHQAQDAEQGAINDTEQKNINGLL